MVADGGCQGVGMVQKVDIDPERNADGSPRVANRMPMWFVYPFFLVHMGMFGASGFVMAYGRETPLGMIYMHGGIAIVVYLVFYLVIFGREQVSWMLVNGALGVVGLWAEIDWILSKFGKSAGDFPWYLHVVPFTYYVLYTFLLWQAVLDITRARDNAPRRRIVRIAYVAISLAIYGTLLLARR